MYLLNRVPWIPPPATPRRWCWPETKVSLCLRPESISLHCGRVERDCDADSGLCVFSLSLSPPLTEDRHLCILSSTSSSMLPSPGELGADPFTPFPSFTEQDSVSLSEGTHTHTHTHTHLYLPSNLYTSVVRCVWRTPAGLHRQPGEGEIHHESHPRHFPARQQLQPHPFPIVSGALWPRLVIIYRLI